MTLQLIRTETLESEGEPVQIIGWLYVHDDEGNLVGTFATLELPWRNNKNGVSCIPPEPGGYKTYNMELLDHSPSFPYEHYWIKDVTNRSYIKIHRGNYYNQIEGCILIGMEHRDTNFDAIKDVYQSTQALQKLISLVGKEAEISIKNLA